MISAHTAALHAERTLLVTQLRIEMQKPEFQRDARVSEWRARIHEITRRLGEGKADPITP